jgi:hypothetical protein
MNIVSNLGPMKSITTSTTTVITTAATTTTTTTTTTYKRHYKSLAETCFIIFCNSCSSS